jgi:hypothetical protein
MISNIYKVLISVLCAYTLLTHLSHNKPRSTVIILTLRIWKFNKINQSNLSKASQLVEWQEQ